MQMLAGKPQQPTTVWQQIGAQVCLSIRSWILAWITGVLS